MIADDAVRAESRGDQLGDPAIAAVREDAPMLLTERLDDRTAIVNGVVAISRATTCNGDDGPVVVAHENLHVVGPAVILRRACSAVIARRHQRAVDDPRSSTIAG